MTTATDRFLYGRLPAEVRPAAGVKGGADPHTRLWNDEAERWKRVTRCTPTRQPEKEDTSPRESLHGL
jgi:hypothetical protein